jgi:uncharacterized membrane protein YbhN (UPF0104 family)
MGTSLVVPLGATAAAFLINYLQAWLVAIALGLTLSFADVIAVVSLGSLLGLLPISISGVGVRETFFALVFPVAFGLGVFGVNTWPIRAIDIAWTAALALVVASVALELWKRRYAPSLDCIRCGLF